MASSKTGIDWERKDILKWEKSDYSKVVQVSITDTTTTAQLLFPNPWIHYERHGWLIFIC